MTVRTTGIDSEAFDKDPEASSQALCCTLPDLYVFASL